MKKIITILLMVGLLVFSGCDNSFEIQDNDEVQISDKNDSKNLDLSTPEKAAKVCIGAFNDENKEILMGCLSEENRDRMQREGSENYISMWKGSIEACIGNILNSEIYEENKAYVYFESKGGCQDRLRMIKESSEWRFDET